MPRQLPMGGVVGRQARAATHLFGSPPIAVLSLHLCLTGEGGRGWGLDGLVGCAGWRRGWKVVKRVRIRCLPVPPASVAVQVLYRVLSGGTVTGTQQ